MSKSKFFQHVVLVAGFVCVSLVNCRPDKNPDYDDEYPSEVGGGEPETRVNSDIPEFLSRNETLAADVNGKLQLPCQVNKLEDIQLIWSFQSENAPNSDNPEILRIGGRDLVSKHYKFKPIFDNGNTVGETLIIEKLGREDAGTYKCTIATTERKFVQFKVEPKSNEVKTQSATSGSTTRRFPELTTSALILALSAAAAAAILRQ